MNWSVFVELFGEFDDRFHSAVGICIGRLIRLTDNDNYDSDIKV